jgi:hypothetical protein
MMKYIWALLLIISLFGVLFSSGDSLIRWTIIVYGNIIMLELSSKD